MLYAVKWDEHSALPLLQAIKDQRIQKILIERAERLGQSPELQGKPLFLSLEGLRSVRAIGQRYRIVFEIEVSSQTVWIIAVGIRKTGDKKDVYEITRNLRKKRKPA